MGAIDSRLRLLPPYARRHQLIAEATGRQIHQACADAALGDGQKVELEKGIQ